MQRDVPRTILTPPCSPTKSSGKKGAVQISNGNGEFASNSQIYILDGSQSLLPYNALILDSSSNDADALGNPIASLVLVPPVASSTIAIPAREGTIAYFDPDGSGNDFYGWDPSNQWVSFTKLTTPADPSGGAIQFNEAGAFAATSNLRWSSSTVPYGDDALIIAGAFNVQDTSGINTSTIQVRNAGGAGGIDIQSDLSCNIIGLASGNINLQTDNGDINSNITGTGNMSFKTAQGYISLDSEMSIDLSANNHIQLKQNTSNIMYATQSNETFLTMGESDLSNNFGISLTLYWDGCFWGNGVGCTGIY